MPRRPPRPAIALAGSLLITLAVLAAAEIGVRLVGVQPREFAARNKPPRFSGMRVDPLLGALPVPGWSGAWFGDFAVEIDEHGFRSSGAPPHPGAERVVFMGDSCSFGWGIDTPETFLARLEARQAGRNPPLFEFLDAAYPGHSAVTGVHMLREAVLPLDPAVVVLGFSADNAFRLATTSDAERFRWFSLRKLILHSRLFHVAAAWLSDRGDRPPAPRNRKAIQQVPLSALRRVAAADEFEAALRTMVGEARAAGAAVLFMVFPRASGVSTKYRYEDAASSVRFIPLPARQSGAPTPRELGLLEVSCLDPWQPEDPIAQLHAQARQWQPVYPNGPLVRAALKQGALAYVKRDFAAAVQAFDAALARQPNSPLALYDRGVAKLGGGEPSGLDDLSAADRLACNVFLHYQVLTWRVATALDVPVVDLTLWFQTHDGELLFLDPAHPNAAGQAIMAEALWPALLQLRGAAAAAR